MQRPKAPALVRRWLERTTHEHERLWDAGARWRSPDEPLRWHPRECNGAADLAGRMVSDARPHFEWSVQTTNLHRLPELGCGRVALRTFSDGGASAGSGCWSALVVVQVAGVWKLLWVAAERVQDTVPALEARALFEATAAARRITQRIRIDRSTAVRHHGWPALPYAERNLLEIEVNRWWR